MSALPILPFDSIPAEVDAVVIGGGLAGGMAALRLASAGFRTVVFDRTAHPREKVCGCCLAPAGIAVLSRCGLAGLLSDASPLEEVLLEAERGAAVVRRPGSVAIARGTLDVRLLAAASAAGALIAWPVSASVDGSGRVELRHGGAVRHLRARIVVAADGLHGSSLARRGDFAWKSSERSLIGVGAIVPAGAVRVAPGQVRMRVCREGYVGVVRLSDGRVDIAAAVRPAFLRAARGVAEPMRAMLGAAVADERAVMDAAWQGTPTLTRSRSRLSAPGILVAGDAAGYAEPFTGEGMGWALGTGCAAGDHAVRVLSGAAVEGEWDPICRGIVRGARLRCLLTARLLRSPLAVKACVRLIQALPGASARVASAFGAPRPVPLGELR